MIHESVAFNNYESETCNQATCSATTTDYTRYNGSCAGAKEKEKSLAFCWNKLHFGHYQIMNDS